MKDNETIYENAFESFMQTMEKKPNNGDILELLFDALWEWDPEYLYFEPLDCLKDFIKSKKPERRLTPFFS